MLCAVKRPSRNPCLSLRPLALECMTWNLERASQSPHYYVVVILLYPARVHSARFIQTRVESTRVSIGTTRRSHIEGKDHDSARESQLFSVLKVQMLSSNKYKKYNKITGVC